MHCSYQCEVKALSAVQSAIGEATKTIKETVALHSGRHSNVNKMSNAIDRLGVACDKGMLDSSDSGVQQAFSASRFHGHRFNTLLSELRDLQDGVQHWNNE